MAATGRLEHLGLLIPTGFLSRSRINRVVLDIWMMQQ